MSTRLLVVSDSNATGYALPAAETWPMRLCSMLDETVQVYGGPGEAIAPLFPLGIASGSAPAGLPVMQGLFGLRYAILALGTNDRGQNVSAQQIQDGVTLLLNQVACPWVVVTPPGVRDEALVGPGGLTMAQVRTAVKTAALAHTGTPVTVIDGDALLPGTNANVLPLPNTVHLTSLAHGILARTIANLISPLP